MPPERSIRTEEGDRGLLFKTAPADFATGDLGKYEGYFSVFDVLDDGDDIIEQGAFAKTLKERGKRIKAFFAHDWSKLIGTNPICKEDKTGLWASGACSLDSFWGKEAWILMRDGAMTEGSIGYRAIRTEFEEVDGKDWPIRHIKELALYEVSPVPLGMNPYTSVHVVKAALGALVDPSRTEQPDELYADTLALILKEIIEGKALVSASPDQRAPIVESMKRALDILKPDKPTEEVAPAAAPLKDQHAALALRLRCIELERSVRSLV